MESKRILYACAEVGEAEKTAVQEVLESPESMVNGDKTKSLEKRVSDLFDKDYGIMVNSGSSANYLAVEALNLPKGSEIITPATTFSTTIAPIVKNDFIPVFVDIDRNTFQVNVQQVEEAITDKTRALMIPSLVGNLPKLDHLREIADDYDLYLIEDSADTIGATYGGEQSGSYTDLSTTSFYGSHVITGFGGGGMACTNHPEIRDTMKKLRGWGRGSAVDETEDVDKRLNTIIDDVQYDSKFVFEEIGYNFLPLEASAAFCLEQLKRLDDIKKKRQENFEKLCGIFRSHSDVFKLPEEYDKVETNWLAFPLTIKESASFTRNELVQHFEQNGIQTRSLWSGNILKHPGFNDIQHRIAPQELTNANYVMEQSFVIGCHQSIDTADIEYIAKTTEEFRS